MDHELTVMYERVLHPTDGSDRAGIATKHAVEIARGFDAPLHVLYVVDVEAIRGDDTFSTPTFEATIETLEAEGEEQIERVRERGERDDIEVTSAITQGTPASTIVENAATGDVIVMGTHGRTGLDRYLIGSTTEKVVRTADVPVVTVPLNEP